MRDLILLSVAVAVIDRRVAADRKLTAAVSGSSVTHSERKRFIILILPE